MSGGGGSSGQTYYANQDKLFGTQADIAQNMYNEYANRAPTYLNNTASMTNEAMSGALATRARNTAGADASAALGQGLQAANRNTARYGAEYNPNRMAQMNKDAAIQGAAMKSSAMNQAEQWSEDQKWNRNAGAYGQIAGMGTGAMEGMGSAGRGYGSMANAASQNDSANAAGMGMAGAYVGKALFAAKGGHVRKTKDGAICLATGGLAPVNWRAQPTSGGGMKKSGGVGQFLSGMAPTALSYGIKESGIGKDIAGGLKDAWGGIKNAITGPQTTELPMGTLTDIAPAGLDAASAAGADATTTAIGEEVGGIAGDAALTGAATTAAEAAALETAGLAAAEAGLGAFGGAAAGAEAGAALGPWGMAAGAIIGGLMSMADGGKVSAKNSMIKRKDMTDGGKVNGPGTETSDDVPAWLSDNEYVLNAEAVKMVGVRNLDRINEQGLKKRGAKQAAKGLPSRSKADGAVKLSMGGNIGVALGAGAKTLMSLDDQQRQNEMLELHKKSDARARESHGLQMEEGRAKAAEAKAIRDTLEAWGAGRERISKGDMTPFNAGMQEYNTNQGVWNNGMKMQISQDGKQLQHIGQDGKVLEVLNNTPENALKIWDVAHDYRLAAASPAFYTKMREDIARSREKALDRAHNIKREDIKDARARDMQALQFEQQSKLQASSPAWGNLALSREEKELARAKEKEKAAVSEALFRERNPEASAAQLAAAKLGILPPIPKDEGQFSTEFKTGPLGGGTVVQTDKRGNAALYTIDPSGKAQAPILIRPPGKSNLSAPTVLQKLQNLQNISPSDISATAKKHGISEEEVVKRLVSQGAKLLGR